MRAILPWQAAAGCLAMGLCLGTAHADTRTLQGFALALTLAGDGDVTIEADPSLAGTVRVVGDALDCLKTESGPGASISTSACDSEMGHLAIMIPPSIPLMVEVAGSGNVSIGDVLGPIKATLSADGDLKIRHANILQLEIRGSGDAAIQTVDGPADISVNGSGEVHLNRVGGALKYRQNGSGDLSIVQINAPVADIETRGSGDTLMLGGRIGVLHASTHGSGDIVMAGTAGTAILEAHGGGDIELHHAEGMVERHGDDSSTIDVGGGREIAASAMRKLRSSLGGGADDSESSSEVATHHAASGFHDFLACVAVLGLLFWGRSIINRNGGFGRLFGGGRRAAAGPPVGPSDPGVVALCDLLAGLERRLARVETHVTSREFELNRKFREIDAGH